MAECINRTAAGLILRRAFWKEGNMLIPFVILTGIACGLANAYIEEGREKKAKIFVTIAITAAFLTGTLAIK